MKKLSDQFELTPEVLRGMDASTKIPEYVAKVPEEITGISDAIDATIAGAMRSAPEKTAQSVLSELRFHHREIGRLIQNLESLPE